MEDSILINSNVAYHTCRNNSQHQYENLSKNCNKESVPIEVGSRAMLKELTRQHLSIDDMDTNTRNHQCWSKLAVDNMKAAQTKIKKVCMVLLCIVLVVITLTPIVLSVLSYKLHVSQTNGESHIRFTACAINEDTITVNGTKRNIIPQDIQFQVNEHIQKELASLQTQLYCGAGQWHRIAFLNMTNPSQQCPPAWREYNTNGVRACGRATSTEGSCSTITYMADNIAYSRVCGQVIGYQIGSPDAFDRPELNPENIDMHGWC